MNWNKNGGYGREQVATLNASANRTNGGLTFGRTLYVMKSGTNHPYFDRMQELLPPDPDGEVRVFTTITAGIAALENYDTLLIGPGNYDEAAKISLDNLKGVKIIGSNTGMQWGEGATNWRNVTSGTDLLDIAGCQGIEIAGIGFVVTSADEDAINFDGLNYSVHIHDCCFVGDVGGGAVMAYGINADGSNGPDLYVHDCRFLRVKTAGIIMGNQRNVIANNVFVVPNSGHGINVPGAAATSYNVIINNHMLGGGTSDVGIYAAASAAGAFMAANNYFVNFADNKGIAAGANSDENCVFNFEADYGTGGGVYNQVDPEN